MWEQYYTSVENNFDKILAFIAKNNMLEHFPEDDWLTKQKRGVAKLEAPLIIINVWVQGLSALRSFVPTARITLSMSIEHNT